MQVQVVLVIRMYRVVSACAYACVREGDGDGDWEEGGIRSTRSVRGRRERERKIDSEDVM